ncbi:MAG: beta strand repeat-containing protein [Terriglobia bacterium]
MSALIPSSRGIWASTPGGPSVTRSNPGAFPARKGAQKAVAARLRLAYDRLPLSFEPNRGQTAPEVSFLAHAPGGAVYLARDSAVLAPAGCASQAPCWVRMKLAGANPASRARPLDELPGRSNYFVGRNPRGWRVGIPQYGRVAYPRIYPGIELIYYGNPQQLEYDFVVRPHASPALIQLELSRPGGVLPLRLSAQGRLEATMPGGLLYFSKPAAFQQDRAGNRRAVASRYVLERSGRVGIRVGVYDRSKPLIIDPSLVYSTYLGGSGGDSATSIAIDSSGNAYVTGGTSSTNFPLSPSGTAPEQKTNAGSSDAFITKLNPTGTAVVYSTYVGGSKYDKGMGIAVDSSGNVYVTGTTSSPDFPTTSKVFQAAYKGTGNSEVFVLELASSGASLTYSTYLGGSGGDFAGGIAIDSTGNAYATGSTSSADFPLQNALQKALAGASDAFVTELNPTGTSLVYSTFLGGTNADSGQAIAVDNVGEAIVAGFTLSSGSTGFPTQNALWPASGGGGDAFIAKLNAGGSALIYSTYFGGSGEDRALAVATDAAGDAYVTGSTQSPNLFTSPGAYQPTPGGGTDAFVLMLNPTGSQAIYSTYLGGSGNDQGNGLAVDGTGNAYVIGSTTSPDLHPVNPLQAAIDQGGCSGAGATCASNAFVAEINPQGTGLVYSTYLGGSGPDYGQAIAVNASSGNAYVAGTTDSSNFPATGGAFQAAYGGQGVTGNGFVAEVSPVNAPALAVNPQSIDFGAEAQGFSSPTQTVTLTNVGSEALAISGVAASSSFAVQSNTCGATLAAGGAQCTVGVQFTPSTTASTTAAMTGTLTITDNAAGSPQTVALSGTASTPAPAITFTPASLTFASVLVGATSAPQTLTLTNSGTAPLSITAVTISGAFTETDNCVTTLAPNKSCTFTVTFAPTTTTGTDASNTSSTTASNTGSIVVTSNLTGTAPAASLAGTPVADFSLGVTGPSSVPTGGATSATITVAATSLLTSFTGNITFACSSEVTCTFNPTQITPAQTTTVTVTGLAGSSGAPNPNPVTFTITGTSGNQTFAANASIATQSFALSATPPLATVTAGQSATYTVTVSSINGFNQPVALSCPSGLPGSATCSFSPSTVTPGPNSPQTSALTITTTAHTGTSFALPAGRSAPPPGSRRLLRDLVLMALLAGVVLTLKRRRLAWIMLGLVVLMALMLASCNMGYYGFTGSNPAPTGSPSGVYTVSVAGTFTPAASSTTQTASQQFTAVNLAVR